MDLSKKLLVLIDVFFALLLLVLLITSGVIFYSIFISDIPFYYVSDGSTDLIDSLSITKIFFTGVVQLLFIAIIFYLRNGIKGMVKENFFHVDVAKNLNIAGVLLAAVSVLTLVFDFISNMSNGLFQLGVETDILKSEVFMVIVGLFLMLMSRLINEGITLKSENDLTI